MWIVEGEIGGSKVDLATSLRAYKVKIDFFGGLIHRNYLWHPLTIANSSLFTFWHRILNFQRIITLPLKIT